METDRNFAPFQCYDTHTESSSYMGAVFACGAFSTFLYGNGSHSNRVGVTPDRAICIGSGSVPWKPAAHWHVYDEVPDGRQTPPFRHGAALHAVLVVPKEW
jgi:hypothetical protein